jgi:diguanylate cyclase (GGDEF)-like protein
MAAGIQEPLDRLNAITGEFRDRAEDRAFRAVAWKSTSHLLQMSFAVAFGISALLDLVDLAVLGFSRSYTIITLLRVGALGPLWAMRRYGHSANTFRALEYSVLLSVAWYSLVCAAVNLLNPEARLYVVIFLVATSVLLSVVDLVSARIMALTWIVWSGVAVVECIATGTFSGPDLVGLSLALVFSGIIGRIVARRSNQLSRLNFLLLREAEEARRRVEKSRQELALIVATDTLTGALARREFLSRGSIELARPRHMSKTLGLLLLDIDHFKAINDRYGHAAGDAALVAFVHALTSTLQGNDAVGRLGGEEFAVLLPDVAATHIGTVAERLRERVAAIALKVPEDTLRFTVSIGGAILASEDTTIEAVIARADQALYAAKRRGRNCVVLEDSLAGESLQHTLRRRAPTETSRSA